MTTLFSCFPNDKNDNAIAVVHAVAGISAVDGITAVAGSTAVAGVSAFDTVESLLLNAWNRRY
jgi:hypothetical protein